MTNSPIVTNSIDYMVPLYQKYGTDLAAVWDKQLVRYEEQFRGNAFFDDIEAEWLYLLVRHIRPTVAIEMSPGVGWSTSWILEGLHDNAHGHLTGFDIAPSPESRLPSVLRWNFVAGDIRDNMHEVPGSIDFLLVDSDHSEPFGSWIINTMLPRVRPGGIGCVHDIYNWRDGGTGEMIAAFDFCKNRGIMPFSPSIAFTETWDDLLTLRGALPFSTHPVNFNPLLVFEAVEYET